jgi:hypothetical protein
MNKFRIFIIFIILLSFQVKNKPLLKTPISTNTIKEFSILKAPIETPQPPEEQALTPQAIYRYTPPKKRTFDPSYALSKSSQKSSFLNPNRKTNFIPYISFVDLDKNEKTQEYIFGINIETKF